MKNILILLLLMHTCGGVYAQQTIVTLKNTPANYSAKNFFIAGVIDGRTDTTKLGTMRSGLKGKLVDVNLSGGTSKGLFEFIDKNVSMNRSGIPIVLQLKKMEIAESNEGGTKTQFNAEFDFLLNGKVIYNFISSGSAQSGIPPNVYVGKLIPDLVQYLTTELDKWIVDNPVAVGKMDGNVKIEILSASTTASHLVYSRSRLLAKEDFAGKVDDMSTAGAITYSGTRVKYNYTGKEIKISLIPFFDKSASWWVATDNVAYILAHEQLHFDISAYFTCVMADRFRKADYANGIEEVIQAVIEEVEGEREDMQVLYDRQTEHGENKLKQLEWADKVKELFATVNCL